MYGQFGFIITLFELTRDPRVFQTLMIIAFRKKIDEFVVIYVDNILIDTISKRNMNDLLKFF